MATSAMVTTTQRPVTEDPDIIKPDSLEAWLENPLDGTEWVDGQLVEKVGMTLTHSKIQGNLYYCWRRYQEENNLGGQTYTEVPCQTKKQGRKPDVAYLTQELLDKYGEPKTLPQSFPLSAEVVSPSDLAEDVYEKADEYLESGGEEVWLIFPENHRVVVITSTTEQTFKSGEVAKTQVALPGFEVSIDELLA
ncbi:MAG: Uma2 family endonuclease [Cyanobacteria bacterium J06634_6]